MPLLWAPAPHGLFLGSLILRNPLAGLAMTMFRLPPGAADGVVYNIAPPTLGQESVATPAVWAPFTRRRGGALASPCAAPIALPDGGVAYVSVFTQFLTDQRDLRDDIDVSANGEAEAKYESENATEDSAEDSAKYEIGGEFRSEIESELEAELGAERRAELGAELGAERRAERRAELRAELGAELGAELRAELGAELRAEIRKIGVENGAAYQAKLAEVQQAEAKLAEVQQAVFRDARERAINTSTVLWPGSGQLVAGLFEPAVDQVVCMAVGLRHRRPTPLSAAGAVGAAAEKGGGGGRVSLWRADPRRRGADPDQGAAAHRRRNCGSSLFLSGFRRGRRRCSRRRSTTKLSRGRLPGKTASMRTVASSRPARS